VNIEQYALVQKGRLLSQEMFPKEPFSEAERLSNLLTNKIRSREPFSMVRFGDGEGRILAYPQLFNDNVLLSEVLAYQFGRKVVPALKAEFGKQWLASSVSCLSGFLHTALDSADVLGVPSHLHFRKPLSRQNIHPRVANSRVLQVVDNLKKQECQLFDLFIFKAMHKQGLLQPMLSGLDFLGVVSHTNNTDQLKQAFNLKQCHHIEIPGHQSFMKSDKLHFPHEYKRVLTSISVPYRGAVYIVAGGYLGKLYCHEIKSQGGIALDIGSVFDSWTGLGRKDAVVDESMRLNVVS
tara:strand:+ start:4934 stop:5815 length:882 start_codon:yes stop_codon:yes gene_type:complete